MIAILLFLILATHLHGAGLGVYNPAQHAVNGFMPTQLPGLVAWLDASRLGGYTNGQSVQTFLDFSGFQRNFTNLSQSKQPTYSAELLNGRPSLKFDGVDDTLSVATNITFSSESVAIVFRQRNTASANLYGRFFTHICTNCGDDYNSTVTPILNLNSANTIGSWRGGGTATLTVNTNQATVFVMTVTASGNLTNYNNTSSAGANISMPTFTTKTMHIADNGAASAFSNADISEVIVLNTHSKIDTVRQLQRYLGTKYGIVVQ